MNQVDNLLKTPFNSLKFAQQVEVIRAGAHQPVDFNLEAVYGGRPRIFNRNWFTKHPWITVSVEKKSVFCFYCILFKPDSEPWSKTGCSDLKHMTDKIKTHEVTTDHLNSLIKFKTFGLQSTYFETPNCKNELKVKAQTHNEKVSRNRHVFGKVIDCLLFCVVHEISLANVGRTTRADALGNHDGRGSFLDMLSMVSNTDSLLADHLRSKYASKYTTASVQSEVLSCVHNVYIDELKKELADTRFVSLQVDKIGGTVGDRGSFAVVLRYVKGTKPVDRFVTCVNVDQQSGQSLGEELKRCLGRFNFNEKVIAQSYRGTNVGSVPHEMLADFPYATNVYSYDGQMEPLIRDMCSSVPFVRLFFINISKFREFFAGSQKRLELLRVVYCEHNDSDPLADTPNDRWNFETDTVSSVNNFQSEILKCLENIIRSEWDDDTISDAFALKMLLKQEEFLFFLGFFFDVLPHVSTLQKKLHGKAAPGQKGIFIAAFENGLFDIRNNVMKYSSAVKTEEDEYAPPAKRPREESREDLHNAAVTVCEMLLNNLTNYLQQTETFSYLSFIKPSIFALKRNNAECASRLCTQYPLVNLLKLGNELLAINGSQLTEIKSISKLLEFLIDHDLTVSLPETCDVLKFTLTIPAPVFPGYAKRFETMDKVKAFCKRNAGNDGLNTLIPCVIHKDVISGISNFTNKVIDEFSNLKNLGSELKFM